MLVSKPTHGGGAPLGIDLEAGIATIKIARPAPAASTEDPAVDPEEHVTEPNDATEPTEDSPDHS